MVSLTYAQTQETRPLFEHSAFTSESVSDRMATEDLVGKIRAATKRFQDSKEAEKSGYRPFGPDMPNMGRHWVNTRMALNREVNISEPSTLTYLLRNNELVLTGVAYTTAVQPGEKPPTLPHPDMHWHYHFGRLEDEAHGIHRKSVDKEQRTLAQLAMVHAWVWSENPDGTFAADNWSLSFLRHGLIPPQQIKKEASEALFLASGHVDYYLRFIELCIEPDSFNMEKINHILSEYSNQIESYISNLSVVTEVTWEQQQHLTTYWDNMWGEIRDLLGTEKWSQVKKHLVHN